MDEVLQLIGDSRLLAAKKAYDKIMCSPENCLDNADSMIIHKTVLDQMLERCQEDISTRGNNKKSLSLSLPSSN
jgi:hypothetical protein